MVESVWVLEHGRIREVSGKGIIRASNEKLSRRILKKCRISVTTEKMDESGRVREKDIIRASNEKLSKWVLKNGRISVIIGK